MYVGKVGGKKDGGIACHTICRFPGKSWVEDSSAFKVGANSVPTGHLES
jgi:hypothetical protein